MGGMSVGEMVKLPEIKAFFNLIGCSLSIAEEMGFVKKFISSPSPA